MPFIVLIVGAILVITAWNDTHGQLADALKKDVPGYLKWALAIAAILALGWIPGFKTPARWLLALVVLVIVVTNYKTIVSGITGFAGTAASPVGSAASDVGQGTVAPSPTTLGATGGESVASLSGTAPVDQVAHAPPPPPNPFDPATFVGSFLTSTAGFGSSA